MATTPTPTPQPELERQRTLALTIPSSVTIVGCGGVGAWVAMFLALAGVPTLYLWDFDDVSETNLNRLPLGPSYLHNNKALALRHMLNELVPRCDIIPMAERWTSDAQAEFPSPTWLVAATDTWSSRRALFTWATDRQDHEGQLPPRCNYIEASAEGEWGGITDSPATFTTDLEEHPGYASVPVHVGPCTLAASMITYHILHAATGTFNYRFGWQDNKLEFQQL